MQFTPPEEQWSIIIDTDSYSGNFEREMGAYITGLETIRGEDLIHDFREAHGVNRKERNVYWNDDPRNPLAEVFMEWPGEHGDELAHICPTPGYGNNGHGEHKKLSELTPAKAEKYLCPAYQSVQLRTNEKPTDEQVKLIKEWAYKFAAKTQDPKPTLAEYEKSGRDNHPFYFQQPIKIIGFRLQCDRMTTEETNLGP